MTAATRFYGKCTGNGPWHLLLAEDGPTRCGRRARFHGRQMPWNTRERDICSKCRAGEKRAAEPPAPARIHVRHDPAALMEEPDLYADEQLGLTEGTDRG